MPEEIYLAAEDQAIEFVLRNLLTNANKFTESGTITISYEKQGTCPALRVTDTGVGMEEEQIDQVLHQTGSFYTIGTRDEKGSGLGLSLVREFLAKIDSSLSIKSKPGEGTAVSFNVSCL